MRRVLLTVFPIAVMTALLIGAAPSKKETADRSIPVADIAAPDPVETSTSESSATRQAAPEPVPIPPAVRPASGGATYAIDWYSLNGGGTVNATSTNYKMGATIAQSVAGSAMSTNYQVGIGFWYGVGATGTCACDCHADPSPIGACDGFQDVTDVVQTVNVAFRNAAAIVDPNANCPYETTDVNCSLATDVIDVVKMVNVSFRNGDPMVEFCNPCL